MRRVSLLAVVCLVGSAVWAGELAERNAARAAIAQARDEGVPTLPQGKVVGKRSRKGRERAKPSVDELLSSERPVFQGVCGVLTAFDASSRVWKLELRGPFGDVTKTHFDVYDFLAKGDSGFRDMWDLAAQLQARENSRTEWVCVRRNARGEATVTFEAILH